jgi:LuxR family maltose regulon positive regulatory protein
MAEPTPAVRDDASIDLLLVTKLRVPPPPPRHIGRARLTARLQQGLAQPLTLIAAPAGSGKTTLLASWLHDARVPAAWVSLDEGDDDPARFWSHALAALDGISAHAGLRETCVPLLQSPQPPPMESILATVVNRLADLPAHVILVFDDYHAITDASIHASVGFMLEHLPQRLHLIIATRADPPLPLARLRARGQLVEIRAADLRFSATEAAAFLAETGAPPLSVRDIAALDARVEGWAAGLQLTALALHDRRDIAEFVQAFTGTHRFVVDYLTEEVLTRQSAAVQEFLLATAILERLCGPLCAAVAGAAEAQEMLERLERANLFLVPLDDERRWYRYHHLFADVLRQRLQRLYPERVAGLHGVASAWYAERGLIRDAVHHALAAADFARATPLIEQAAESMTKRGEVATLRAWLDRLPADDIRARAGIGLWRALLLALDGQLDAADRLLETLEDHGDTSRGSVSLSARDYPGWVAAIRALIAFRRGDAPRTIALAREAIEQLPKELALRALVSWSAGIAHLWKGDLAAGEVALTEASVGGLASGNRYAACMAAFELAQAQARRGHLHDADRRYRDALDSAAEGGDFLAATGPLYVGRGDLRREWNHLEAAAADLEEGITRCEQVGSRAILLVGCVALARVRQAQGDAANAGALMRTIAQTLRTHPFPPHNAAPLAAWHARLSLGQGDLAAAARWAEGRQLRADDTPDPPREVEYLTWARIQLAQGHAAAVVPVLQRLLGLAEAQGRVGSVPEILVLAALARLAVGDEHGAMETIGRALALAEPEGYIRLFVDEGAPMARLLAHMRAERPGAHLASARYRDHLLVLLGGAPEVNAPRPATALPGPRTPARGEPLRARELEILRLIAVGCSNREIADRLVIAVSTVKWYVNAIYGKLQVESRTQAVARARELDLL